METDASSQHESSPNRWHGLAIALLAGIVTQGGMAFVATLFQTPGLEGPIQIAPISVVVTVLGVTALPLVWWDDPVGYAVAALVGAVAIVGIALYVTGAFGPPRIAPAAYVFALVGTALVVTIVVAWRERSPTRGASSATPASK